MTKLNIIEKIDNETIVRPTTFGKVTYIMNEIVDKKAELEKINKELTRLEAEISRSNGMLSNGTPSCSSILSRLNLSISHVACSHIQL